VRVDAWANTISLQISRFSDVTEFVHPCGVPKLRSHLWIALIYWQHRGFDTPARSEQGTLPFLFCPLYPRQAALH